VLGAFNDLRSMGEQSGRLTGLRDMITNAMSEAYASNWDKDSLE
jgi:hypothetical protein